MVGLSSLIAHVMRWFAEMRALQPPIRRPPLLARTTTRPGLAEVRLTSSRLPWRTRRNGDRGFRSRRLPARGLCRTSPGTSGAGRGTGASTILMTASPTPPEGVRAATRT